MYKRYMISSFLIIGLVFGIVSFVSAEPNAGITLYPTSSAGSACIGHDVTYDIRITNNTGVLTSFTLSYTSEWPYIAPPVTPSIPIGGFWDFQVIVHIPWTADPGNIDVLSISAAGGGYTANATISTTANYLNSWVDYSNNPRGVRFTSVVYYGGRIYKIGGDNEGAQAWLDIYDIASNTWSTGMDMPEQRSYIDCEAISGYIYCAGGLSSSGQSTLFIYNIGMNSWSTGANLPYGLYSYAAVSMDGLYYIIGGRTSSLTYSDAILAYNPSTNSWDETLSPMSTARRFHSAGVIGGKIYVAGGYNGILLAAAESYDPDLDSWTSIASLPAPRVNAADGVYEERFLVLAGGSSTSISSPTDEALIYDVSTDTWKWLPNMTHQLYGAEGDGDGSAFWVVSGQTFINGVGYTASEFTTLMDVCEPTCASPVTGANFNWEPVDPWTNYPVTFSASVASGADPISYLWDFADNTNGTEDVIDHTFTSEQTYNVELTASNCDGASTATVSHDVVVVDPPQITADQSTLDSIQLPDTITSQILELCNSGSYPLTWALSEALPLQVSQVIPETNLKIDLTWLSESPTGGMILANSCTPITITFNSQGLSDGVYRGSLNIESNDPIHLLLNVPVTLSIAPPGIELVKTVSLQEYTCGTADNLFVYENTIVYYCYTVTNTGGILFNLHDLVDDQLGDILSNYNLNLDVGDSTMIISDGVRVTETLSNEATWTAYNGEISAFSSATATVTIIPNPDFWVFLTTILKIPSP